MNDRYNTIHRQICEGVEQCAAEKLGRPLTTNERHAIQNVRALMLLEAIEREMGHVKNAAEAEKILSKLSQYGNPPENS